MTLDLTKPLSTHRFVKEIYKILAPETNVPWYGIQYDTASPSPVLLRIASEGGMWQHVDLPVQSKLRRCVIGGVTGELKYYLHPTDSTLKADGITPSVLDGTDGQVMVEIPEHWRKCEEEETIVRVKISESELTGGVLVPKIYISAFEPTLDRSDPLVYKLASVVNESASFRGGNNNEGWDEEPRTLLGRPVTNFTLDQFRHYASNRNAGDPSWNALLFEAHKALQWLYYIEYANFNSQAEFNPTDDFNGFKQGGLGIGCTNLDEWSYVEYQPFIPCGITNSLGNASGEVAYPIPAEFTSQLTEIMVCSYRGVENIFGHIYKWGDGVHITTIMVGEDQKATIWMTDDPSRLGDSSNRYFDLRGMAPESDGGISKFALGKHADTIGVEFAGDPASTYMMDYGSLYGQENACNIVRLAGGAISGSGAGLGCAGTGGDPSNASTCYGSRLCFKVVGASAPRRTMLLQD